MRSDRQPGTRSFTETHALQPPFPPLHRPLSPVPVTYLGHRGQRITPPLRGRWAWPWQRAGRATPPCIPGRNNPGRARRAPPRPQPLETPVSTALDTSPTAESHLPFPPR